MKTPNTTNRKHPFMSEARSWTKEEASELAQHLEAFQWPYIKREDCYGVHPDHITDAAALIRWQAEHIEELEKRCKQSERLRDVERRVWNWQVGGHVHPLTCGTKEKHRFPDFSSEMFNPSHDILRPDIVGEAVVLKCPTCDYVQTWIPSVVSGVLTGEEASK